MLRALIDSLTFSTDLVELSTNVTYKRDVIEFDWGIDEMESYTGTKHTGHDDIQQYNDTESVKSNHKDNLAQNTNTQQWNSMKYFNLHS
jgi:hypothetical protein